MVDGDGDGDGRTRTRRTRTRRMMGLLFLIFGIKRK